MGIQEIPRFSSGNIGNSNDPFKDEDGHLKINALLLCQRPCITDSLLFDDNIVNAILAIHFHSTSMYLFPLNDELRSCKNIHLENPRNQHIIVKGLNKKTILKLKQKRMNPLIHQAHRTKLQKFHGQELK